MRIDLKCHARRDDCKDPSGQKGMKSRKWQEDESMVVRQFARVVVFDDTTKQKGFPITHILVKELYIELNARQGHVQVFFSCTAVVNVRQSGNC